ncbi:DUF7701 domain-containing protein [Candidatus Solirubrobacter pratensis]|uniref:DUF7701 domain-containing protein n=1 Tax=Candidatus Solirubrobacter pratensis TaxID=1298857 RepID=UPI000686614A|nr:hypothetical protein [Candidatus Solirubrobacter pratensis]
MSDYISTIATEICELVPATQRPGTDDDLRLFRLYAVLALVKGTDVSAEDVHDAWCAWIVDQDPDHQALVPYAMLGADQQRQDEPFVRAIVAVASVINRSR